MSKYLTLMSLALACGSWAAAQGNPTGKGAAALAHAGSTNKSPTWCSTAACAGVAGTAE